MTLASRRLLLGHHSASVALILAAVNPLPALAEPEKRVSEAVDLVFIPERNFTLTRDANLFRTQATHYAGPFSSLVAEIISEVGSIEGRQLIASDFNVASGGMRWYGAVAWITWLNRKNFAGASNWRLWTPDPACGGRPGDPGLTPCPNGELGYIYSSIGQLEVSGSPNPANGQGWTADPPGILKDYFVQLDRDYWASNGQNTFGWAKWMIASGGLQLAYNYTDPQIPNFFRGWPVRTGVLGRPAAILKDGFESPKSTQDTE